MDPVTADQLRENADTHYRNWLKLTYKAIIESSYRGEYMLTFKCPLPDSHRIKDSENDLRLLFPGVTVTVNVGSSVIVTWK